MPICPFCRKNIHEGAKEQCPSCSYRLEQAEENLGRGFVEFPRVLDSAGVFSREERSELMDFLEKLEKRISPVALGVYLTDRGRKDELSVHAHWLLNHLKINHASFGARAYKCAVEDSQVQVNIGGSASPTEFTPLVPSTWSKISKIFSRLMLPMKELGAQLFDAPPLPVEREWMLILVMDVQLGRACFTWGYNLDNYVDPHSLSLNIASAYSSFREKDVLGGIKKVMDKTVSMLAKDANEVNSQYKSFKKRSVKNSLKAAVDEAEKTGAQIVKNALKGGMLIPLLFSLSPLDVAQAQDVPPVDEGSGALELPSSMDSDPALDLDRPIALDEEEAAAEEELMAQEVQEVEAPRIFYGSPASLAYFPSRGTLEEQMGLTTSRALFASVLPRESDAQEKTPAQNASDKSAEDAEEPTEEIPTIILEPWVAPAPPMDGASLQDEDYLLSDLARQDIENRLKECNANKPYHIYISVVDARHGQISAFSADALLPLIARLGEQALLIQYYVGGSTPVELAMQGLNLSPEQKQEWRDALLTVAQSYSDERSALLVLMGHACTLLDAQIPYLRKGGVDDTLYLPLADVGLVEAEKEAAAAQLQVKPSMKDEWVKKAMSLEPFAWLGLSCLISIISCVLLYLWYFRSAVLMETPLDKRLSSPSGAGVSPVVLYKESYTRKRLEEDN